MSAGLLLLELSEELNAKVRLFRILILIYIQTCTLVSMMILLFVENYKELMLILFYLTMVVYYIAGEGWLGFPDLLSGLKPWWNIYLTSVVNFGEVRKAQLAKSTLLTSTFVPLGCYQIFNICPDAKERVGCGKQREATAPIQSLVKLQPWFLSLRCKTCLR